MKTESGLLGLASAGLLILAATASSGSGGLVQDVNPLLHPDEKHLRNLRQLTFGGENAEAY